MINIIIEKEKILDKMATLEQMNDLYYACQMTYEEMTKVNKVQNNWETNIKNKVQKLEDKMKAIDNFLTTKEVSAKVKRILQNRGCHSNNTGRVKIIRDEISEKIASHKRRLDVNNNRIKFHIDNERFEFNRKRFYRGIDEQQRKVSENVNQTEVLEFWQQMWSKSDQDENEFDDIVGTLDPVQLQVEVDDDRQREIIMATIKYLANWKTPGHDMVYNFFIKKIDSTHQKLSDLIIDAIKNPEKIHQTFYEGTTYLIPKKKESAKPEEFRPITCLPNMYKLISKIVTKIITDILDTNQVISPNQLGTKRGTQGAKEQALINKTINSSNNYQLFTSWIDVKKAYDSVSHVYLIECLQQLNLPTNLVNFVQRMLCNQRTKLIVNGNSIGSAAIDKGILQGDSLSPKLFVLALEPLSRILNRKCEKISVRDTELKRNHILFIDDIKLFAKNRDALNEICKETREWLNQIGLKTNEEKSASNTIDEFTFGQIPDEMKGYKYLGVWEDKNSFIKSENKIMIRNKIMDRVIKLADTKLSARNLFKAINEFAISTINYYIGIIEFEPEEIKNIDSDIRKILVDKKISRKAANVDRLYLPRKQLGRGLFNIEERSETMLVSLHEYLSTRSDLTPVLDSEKENVTHLATINQYIQQKYCLEPNAQISTVDLIKLQSEKRINKIKEKTLHGVLFENEEEVIDIAGSTIWLTKGMISPQEEGMLTKVQDRNLFFANQQCNHCGKAKKSVDHLATKCGRILDTDYKRRHNEIVRCLHFMFTKRYGLSRRNKLKNYKVENVLSNERVLIKSDLPIQTQLRIENNKPDLMVFDKKKKEIILVEVGVTNKDRLKTTETTKARKYEILANELAIMYGAKVVQIPVVLTWDGLVTRYFKKYMEMLQVDQRTQAYIQYKTIKKTAESILIDLRGGLEEVVHDDEMEKLLELLERE
uniref:Uncharacterized protein LOC113793939 n=1 Tax=Dermatophagoides pteronyssinus TaxID=6956 RepID=A0A6P6Y2V4_DERPT|nr:uncharacterized protein LOC113793939 [Dermatophagoides pteronyssinus]